MHMEVGTKLKIQIEGSKAKLESELMGIEDHQRLLIKMPPIYTVIDASKFVYKGKTIFVRYQAKGSVFGFQTFPFLTHRHFCWTNCLLTVSNTSKFWQWFFAVFCI